MGLNNDFGELGNMIDRSLLEEFVARGWIAPREGESGFVFEEVDVARARLVQDLFIDMALEKESIDLILSLLDQLYAARNKMHVLANALSDQPESVRDEILQTVIRACQKDEPESKKH